MASISEKAKNQVLVILLLCTVLEDFPPSFIPAHWNIGILHHKQAKLRKYMQQSVPMTM